MTGRRRGRRHGHGSGALPPRPGSDDALVMAPAEVLVVDEPVDIVAVPVADGDGQQPKPAGTAAQMRRFIKSRPYVPLHELRRRFGIEGDEDEVSGFAASDGPLYVGLPLREAQLLGELIRSGEVGYELLLDPTSPLVVGVFPMKPVARS